jgi:peptidoglycan/LPS O-acetylase OafA/YrhL
VLSVGEDVGSLTLVVLAFAVPLLAVVLLALLVVPFVRWWSRRRRRRPR